MSSSTIAEALATALASLPAGANPFLAADELLRASLKRDLPKSFYTQLYILAGVFGLNLICVVSVCALQIAARRFWVFRWDSGSLRPHGTIPWQLAGGLWYAFAEVAVFRSIRYYRGEVVRDLMGWRAFMWMAPWAGGWIAAHALSVSFCQHLASTTSSLDTVATSKVLRRLTIFFYSVLALFFATSGYLGAVAVSRYQATLDAFESIDSELRQQAATYTGTFDLTALAWLAPAFDDLSARRAKLEAALRVFYGVYGGWGIVLIVGVDLAAWLHTRSLGRLLRETAALRLEGSVTSSTEQRARTFRKTYITLVLTIWAFTFIALGFTAISFYVAIETHAAMNDPEPIMAVDLVMYYLYASMGAFVGMLLLARTIRSRQPVANASTANSSSQPRRLKTPRGVNVDVTTFVTVHGREEASLHQGQEFQMANLPTTTYIADEEALRDAGRSRELYFVELDGKDSRKGSIPAGEGLEKA